MEKVHIRRVNKSKLERLRAILERLWEKVGQLQESFCGEIKLEREHRMVVCAGDVGAVFACVGSLQAVFGFLSPLYNKLYAAVRVALIKKLRDYLGIFPKCFVGDFRVI